jgi:hypothetical protein
LDQFGTAFNSNPLTPLEVRAIQAKVNRLPATLRESGVAS